MAPRCFLPSTRQTAAAERLWIVPKTRCPALAVLARKPQRSRPIEGHSLLRGQERRRDQTMSAGLLAPPTSVLDIKSHIPGKPLVDSRSASTPEGKIVGARLTGAQREPILLVGDPREGAARLHRTWYVGAALPRHSASWSEPSSDPKAVAQVDVISGATVTALAQNQHHPQDCTRGRHSRGRCHRHSRRSCLVISSSSPKSHGAGQELEADRRVFGQPSRSPNEADGSGSVARPSSTSSTPLPTPLRLDARFSAIGTYEHADGGARSRGSTSS